MKPRDTPLPLWTLGLLCLVILPLTLVSNVQPVQADAGPKPTMAFTFVQESGTPLTIMEGILLECEDEMCTYPEPLPEMGPQGFTCTENQCTSQAYGYSDYHRLSIRFSDGQLRESNVFNKQAFQATYQVSVREEDLVVEETVSLTHPMTFKLIGGMWGLFAIAAFAMTFFVILAVRVRKTAEAPLRFNDAPALFIIAWLFVLVTSTAGGFLYLTLPLTVALEAGVTLLYTTIRKRPSAYLVTLTLLVNLITQPLLWVAVGGQQVGFPHLVAGMMEILIWLIEAGLLYFTQRQTYSFKAALLLSLLMNGTSFVAGLLLPV